MVTLRPGAIEICDRAAHSVPPPKVVDLVASKVYLFWVAEIRRAVQQLRAPATLAGRTAPATRSFCTWFHCNRPRTELMRYESRRARWDFAIRTIRLFGSEPGSWFLVESNALELKASKLKTAAIGHLFWCFFYIHLNAPARTRTKNRALIPPLIIAPRPQASRGRGGLWQASGFCALCPMLYVV